MNKQELIKRVADRLELPQERVKEAYKAIVNVIQEEIMDKEQTRIVLPGLVTFTKTAQEASVKRNPRTGDPVNVDAHTRLKAAPTPHLKDAVRHA